MNISLGQTITRDFTTHNPVTGQVSDADFLPTCQVFEDTTDTPILSPAVTKRAGTTGNYRVTFVTSPENGFETGKSYNVIVTATVGGVTAKARILAFNIEEEKPLYDFGPVATALSVLGVVVFLGLVSGMVSTMVPTVMEELEE